MTNLREPLGIVGIGCRFPGGASSPDMFWELLRNRRDAVVEIPADRWDWRRFYDPDRSAPGKMYVRHGGFLKDTDMTTMDAAFFGMSPREATPLDPQQRLLLEVTWEAFEDAAIDPGSLRQHSVGVFVGGFTLDNLVAQLGLLCRDAIEQHTGTGSTMVMLSNRLSYMFDLRGPSMSVDTACSSSLTAFHLGCQSLWSGESELAVVGGVNLMHRPEYFIAMCKGGFLSPDGRCKSFDASADGYGRGEGAGVVLIKPLSAALAGGDRIYATVLATAVNQDGRTSGITVPNRASQEALLHRVYNESGLSPSHIRYIEAHGTGTQVGDPIEANALSTVLSQGRDPDDVCFVGSVKSNIGHLEAAAGIAGIIKTALILSRRVVPPNLHFETPNPKIDFESLRLRVPTRCTSLDGPLYAGVNSFGYGGANAHAVLGEAPLIERTATHATSDVTSSDPRLFVISGRSEQALEQTAKDLANYLDAQPHLNLADVQHTLARRASHTYRRAVWSESPEALAQALRSGTGVSGRSRQENASRVVFVYPGMGAQWWGMGARLYEVESGFREAIQACDCVWQQLGEPSLLPRFGWAKQPALVGEWGDPMEEPIDAQPANLFIQIALTRMLETLGVQPDAIVGHSVGEIAAAWAAGSLDLEAACRLTLHRSRLQQQLVGQGAMLAVDLTGKALETLLTDFPTLDIAVYNSPELVVLSGDEDTLKRLADQLDEQQRFHRFLRVRVPYHSRSMDQLKDRFLNVLHGFVSQSPKIDLYSTVTGEQVYDASQDARYWWKNTRNPVQLHQAILSTTSEIDTIYLEIGPHPMLATAIQTSLRETKGLSQTVQTLHRNEDETDTLRQTTAQLAVNGAKLSLPSDGRPIRLPTYPWQRERFWGETEACVVDRLGKNPHPLFTVPLDDPAAGWEICLRAPYAGYLPDHVVADTVLVLYRG